MIAMNDAEQRALDHLRRIRDADQDGQLVLRLGISEGDHDPAIAERHDAEWTVDPDGQVDIEPRGPGPARTASSVRIDPDVSRRVIDAVLDHAEQLTTRSDASFVPSSAVGSATVEADDQTLTLYFLLDEGQSWDQPDARAPDAVMEAVRDLRRAVENQEQS